MEDKKPQNRAFKGTVVSDRMEKTVVVRVDHMKVHPKYQKTYRQSKRYKVHDSKGEAKAGDLVRFEECRPLSKDKRWMVTEILEKAKV